MSFGKRTGSIPASPSERAVRAGASPHSPRRGGYWLALLTTAVSAVASGCVMVFIPLFNPTGAAFGDMFEALVFSAMPTIMVGAAIMFLGVDLLLKALGQRKAWLYALLSPLPAVIATIVVASLGSGTMRFVLLFVVVVPGILGGWVLGRNREAT